MNVNDVIKTKSGNLYTVQRAERMGKENMEFLLLYEVRNGDLLIGYVEDGNLEFVNDPQQRMAIAKQFDLRNNNAV